MCFMVEKNCEDHETHEDYTIPFLLNEEIILCILLSGKYSDSVSTFALIFSLP